MATLLLVRHGQASALSQDYDQLSPLGEDQARRLGALWARLGVRVDRLHHGPRRRQRGTARILAEALQGAGRPVPEIVEVEDLDEMRLEGLMESSASLREQAPELGPLFDALLSAETPEARSRAFMAAGSRVMRHWAHGTIRAPGVEDFPTFRARIARALEGARSGVAKGARVVCATSAGVVGCAAHLVLGLHADATVDLMLRARNSSVSEILFSGARVTWSSFNELPHLADRPDLHTLV